MRKLDEWKNIIKRAIGKNIWLSRLCIFFAYSRAPLKTLLPGHLWLNKIDVVITTKYNRLC